MTPKMLAAAIRKGHTMIGETTSYFFSASDNCGCAIGAAVVAMNVVEQERAAIMQCKNAAEYFRLVSTLLGAPADLLSKVSEKHSGGMPRLAIADWLETLDVSKPKDAQSFNDFMKVVTQPVEMEAA